MVLGCYYMTKARPGDKGEGIVFSSMEQAMIAYDQQQVALHARVKVRVARHHGTGREVDGLKIIDTSMGRIIFNSIVPEGIPDSSTRFSPSGARPDHRVRFSTSPAT